MVRLRAGSAAFVVPAAFIGPIATELPAGRGCFEARLHFSPGGLTVLVHIFAGNSVGYALEAEGREEPVEKRRRATKGNGLIQPCLASFHIDLVKKRCRTCHRANGSDERYSARDLVGGVGRRINAYCGAREPRSRRRGLGC